MAFIDKAVGRVEFKRVHSNPPFCLKRFHTPLLLKYCVYFASAPSLHIQSTDALIFTLDWKMYIVATFNHNLYHDSQRYL